MEWKDCAVCIVGHPHAYCSGRQASEKRRNKHFCFPDLMYLESNVCEMFLIY